ncbi:unnamed protein product [Nezara viridula]|uniref:Uncharacterized protein n=1 Tax=Nezara viridula TaxID=85310 RepID=A0A9P0MS97_NEZVI|nr:unnamed protein product [Nezara viridula]
MPTESPSSSFSPFQRHGRQELTLQHWMTSKIQKTSTEIRSHDSSGGTIHKEQCLEVTCKKERNSRKLG